MALTIHFRAGMYPSTFPHTLIKWLMSVVLVIQQLSKSFFHAKVKQ